MVGLFISGVYWQYIISTTVFFVRKIKRAGITIFALFVLLPALSSHVNQEDTILATIG
jgi:hypothetical protein